MMLAVPLPAVVLANEEQPASDPANGTEIFKDKGTSASGDRAEKDAGGDNTGAEKNSTDIHVKIDWDDDDDAYGFRSSEVTVRVKPKTGSDEVLAEYDLKASEGWEHTFTGLPEQDTDENRTGVTVEEEERPGYTPGIEETGNGFVITNRLDEPYQPEDDDDDIHDICTKHKYVTYRKDGTYDLTLTVQDVNDTGREPVDVLFVVDTSSSMRNRMTDETAVDPTSPQSRIYHLVNAKNTLVDHISRHPELDPRYSIVSFDSYYYDQTYQDAKVWVDWTSSADTAKNGFTTSAVANDDLHGTNYTHGLFVAARQLEKARAEAPTVVIFLSDGAPTRYTVYRNGKVYGAGGHGRYENNTVKSVCIMLC